MASKKYLRSYFVKTDNTNKERRAWLPKGAVLIGRDGYLQR